MTYRALPFLLALALAVSPSRVAACGGFFCSQSPVDQSGERILFAIDDDAGTTDMIVQIQYSGGADDFAWIVPLGAVPLEGSLATFPEAALLALDARTAPAIRIDYECASAGIEQLAGTEPTDADVGAVTVHAREVVGPYDTAVVGSDDPEALVTWLRDNGFRVTAEMEPYIALYTRERRVFLALRLTSESGVQDIVPFRMTLPGTTPGIPLRMTALAAEPEMGILVTILGSQRYEGANWPNVEIAPSEIAVDLDYDTYAYRFNWFAAVARAVDAAGGRGWVTERASSTDELVAVLERSMAADEEQAEALAAIRDVLTGRRYVSRLYTRLSPEEMTSDPIFRRSSGGDVLTHEADLFDGDACEPRVPSPCAFLACGAGGLCAEVDDDVAGCACVPGATARTTVSPDGFAEVTCVDRTMSFVVPGLATPGMPALADPCVGFDCGAGRCVTVNMTPTCDCDRGAVAIGTIDTGGRRTTSCTIPRVAIPAAFYDRVLPARPPELGPPWALGGGGPTCAASSARAPSWLLVLALIGSAWLARRRRS